MGYSNEKLKPSLLLQYSSPNIIFNSVRSTTKHKTLRDRTCFNCLGKIKKGEEYILHQFRYDKKIISVSYDLKCFKNGMD